MVFLQSHGVGIAKAVRIYKTYGDQAVELVRANPYRLSGDVWGFGFQSADQLARQMGLDPASPLRARAAVRHVLQQLSQTHGHVGYPEAGLVAATVQMLAEIDKGEKITSEIVNAAVEAGRAEEELVREPGLDEPWLYLKHLFLAEHGLARVLVRLGQGPHPMPRLDADAALGRVEQKLGLGLAPKQRDAVRMATQHKLLVITGGPGTGKTTLVRSILEVFASRGLRCALCAPTGRAAKRLSETTGREAKTIHRLLEFDPALGYFKRDQNQPLDADLVVVDETSMVDVSLMYSLVKAVPYRACLVLVGDVDQLPSVGPGTVLADLINSGVLPVVRLTEIFRQAESSWIVRAAHAVNQGHLPESAPPGQGDFYFVEASSEDAILERIVTMVRERIPAKFGLDPVRDVQVLAPMHKSQLGTRNLNVELQKVLNPPRGGSEVERNGWTFRAGDKVLQTVNDYDKEVFNGDVGRVRAVDPAERELTVEFEGREVVYDFDELDELQLAFGLSVHKAQGSEYPAVVVPLHTQHFMMLQRNLLYTAVTRGKRLVVVVGSRRALEMAVQRQDTARRYSALAWRLQQQAAEE
jgi:exodeoxyribonuclease V alpha subunit